jgi:hypothetical protein
MFDYCQNVSESKMINDEQQIKNHTYINHHALNSIITKISDEYERIII